jgi:hypothetical protein
MWAFRGILIGFPLILGVECEFIESQELPVEGRSIIAKIDPANFTKTVSYLVMKRYGSLQKSHLYTSPGL